MTGSDTKWVRAGQGDLQVGDYIVGWERIGLGLNREVRGTITAFSGSSTFIDNREFELQVNSPVKRTRRLKG